MKSSYRLVNTFGATFLLAALMAGMPKNASAAACFATDADDVYDKDGVANGVITITSASTSAVPPAADAYDCTALDFVVSSGGRLTFQGDGATGAIVVLQAGDVTVDAGGVIEADLQGCIGGASASTGPNDQNVCTSGDPSGGQNGNDFGGSGGGAHGGRGGSGGQGAGGLTHDSATAPASFGASGGSTGGGPGNGGDGGGVVGILAASLTHNGLISANAGDGDGGGNRVTGGGAGGSIQIVVGSLAGVTGTFEARGGDGEIGGFTSGGGGGGGGGGRIAISFNASTFVLDAGAFDVRGGTGSTAGETGTVYTRDSAQQVVRIFHGFTFVDEDIVESVWAVDDSAGNQYCDRNIAADATPSITATDVSLAGSLRCDEQVASFTIAHTSEIGTLFIANDASVTVNGALKLDAAATLGIGTNVSLANTQLGTSMEIAVPDGNDQIWNDVSIDGAVEGRIIIDSAIALSLLNGTTVAGNPAWPALTALALDASSAIRADSKGCHGSVGGNGFGPDETKACVALGTGTGGNGNDGGGSGGGGHGGQGAAGGAGAGGVTYGSATVPSDFGASGGSTGGTNASGGFGGGLIEITTASLVHDGVISADGQTGGGTGGRVTGGGAGGSIFIAAGTLAGTTGTFTAGGGDGAQGGFEPAGGGGGGGGGRIAVLYDTSTFLFDAGDFDVDGGAGGSGSAKGTVYVRDRTTSSVRVFHGFTFADVDHDESSWSADPSATNQYCDRTLATDATPSITAADVTLGGAIDCAPQITSFDVTQTAPGGALTFLDDASVSVNGALMLDAATDLAIGTGVTIANTLRGADLVLELPDGNDQIWNGVTVDAAPEGRFFADAAIALSLIANTTVRANAALPALTALTIDATSSIRADAKGCQALGNSGFAPTCANECTAGQKGSGGNGADAGGGGGGGHGGTGGNGGVGAGGAVYDMEVDPRLFGASGGPTGGAAGPGGPGGGLVEISVAGTLSNDGAISADGGDGAGSGGRTTGAGSGGTLNITAGTYACTTGGGFSAAGGNGPAASNTGGGGGGGGRIVVDAGTDTCANAPLTALDAAVATAGGTSESGALAGANGTVRFGATRACADPRAFRAEAPDGEQGAITATDALFVLQAAIGSQCCSLCVCDVNGSDDITASDALLALKRAVGQAIDLLCPPCG